MFELLKIRRNCVFQQGNDIFLFPLHSDRPWSSVRHLDRVLL